MSIETKICWKRKINTFFKPIHFLPLSKYGKIIFETKKQQFSYFFHHFKNQNIRQRGKKFRIRIFMSFRTLVSSSTNKQLSADDDTIWHYENTRYFYFALFCFASTLTFVSVYSRMAYNKQIGVYIHLLHMCNFHLSP